MAESVRSVDKAIRRLREALGDTQTKFAERLGTSARTIIRWEQGEMPRDSALVALEQLSRPWEECARVFRFAREGKAADLGPSVEPDNTPRDFEEKKIIHAFLDVWRNPEIYPNQHKAVRRLLRPALDRVEKAVDEAQAARDAQQFVIRLLERGEKAEAVAAKLDIPLKHVNAILVAHKLQSWMKNLEEQK